MLRRSSPIVIGRFLFLKMAGVREEDLQQVRRGSRRRDRTTKSSVDEPRQIA
jgi:hypothetical protein